MSPPPVEVALRCERADAAAWADLLSAAPAEAARALGIGARRIGPAFAGSIPRLDILMYNRVVGLGLESPATAAQLDEAVGFFREAGAPRCMVNVSPAAGPLGLARWLEARGFYLHNHWVKLHRDMTPAPRARTDLRIAPLEPAHAAEFARIVIGGMGHPESLVPLVAALAGRPGWHLFGAFEGDTLAATGGLFVEGRLGWLGFASTRPAHRGRGAQSALIARRIQAAAERGCDSLVVETAEGKPEKPNPSTHNLLRLGFQVAYRRPNYVRVEARAEP